jgi:hypothetical protein
MYPLAIAIPAVRRLRIPLSRDQVMTLLVAFNELMLAVEIYLAHSISGTMVPNEWIPIIFGPIAAALLGIAGLISLRNRPLALWIASPTLIASLAVGFLGAYFHSLRAVLPFAPAGEQVSLSLVIWAPPILGPLTFVLVGLLGLSAIWEEDPPDSGILRLFGEARMRLPFSKTRGYFFLASLGLLATLISSVLDHARTNFSNPWLWVPTAAGVFATVVALGIGMLDKPSPSDVWVYLATMVAVILVGGTGSVLHILSNLSVDNTIVGERFIHGAPMLAPLLFSDLATIALVALLDPDPHKASREAETDDHEGE